MRIQPVASAAAAGSQLVEEAQKHGNIKKKEIEPADASSDKNKESKPSSMSKEDVIVIEIAKELHETCPAVLDRAEVTKDILKLNSKGLLHCFSIVFLQERERYNKLIQIIQTSLDLLIKAIQGIVLMSPELD